MEDQFKRYQLGMVDRDEHFNQELYYQFRIDDLDFSYSVKYDGSKGFEHSEYIKPGVDINDLRDQIGPRTVTDMMVSFFKKVQKMNKHG